MAKSAHEKTIADYLAIGVSPVLIMLLVGSLTFFLQAMAYGGEFDSRVKWILFWFVVGSVLIARIAIESGRSHASVFSLALGGAVALAVFKFVPDKPLVVVASLGLIWWLTDKLTWDSTLIDEREDASGQGLLEVAGVEKSADPAASGDAEPTRGKTKTPFWLRLFVNTSGEKGKPHAPGLWVVYFSLVALPIFGFGQALIPRTQAAERGFAFRCVFVYVAAALGLLMLTSFLGLRRYLRQRGLQMPTSMAVSWVAIGSAIVVGLLCACLLLPRPQGEFTLTAMIDKASDEIQEASDRAALKMDGVREPQKTDAAAGPQQQGPNPNQQPGAAGQPGKQPANGQTPQDGKDQSQTAQGKDQKSSDSKNGNGQDSKQPPDKPNPDQQAQQQPQKPGDQKPSDQQKTSPAKDKVEPQNIDAQNKEESKDAQDRPAEQQPTPTTPPSPKLPELSEMTGKLFQWIAYGLLAAVAIWLAFKYWAQVMEFLRRLWHELLSLFGRSSSAAVAESDGADSEELVARPFAEFTNPFASGRARKLAPRELVRYTFEALQAWASEHGCERRPDQTPMEFGQRLLASKQELAADANEVTQLYARVAYAGFTPNGESLDLLERLWRRMK